MLNNAVKAQRAEEMKNSDQLTLGELILKLEAVKNKDLPIFFDRDEFKPTGLTSWRGRYDELSITYEEGGGTSCYEQMKEDCEKDEFKDHKYDCKCGGSKEFSTQLSTEPTAQEFLNLLKGIQGKVFIGYKGGDNIMGKTTPIWVANYGRSSGFEYEDENIYYTKVIDIIEENDRVLIETKGDK